jgi:hypothetical protein
VIGMTARMARFLGLSTLALVASCATVEPIPTGPAVVEIVGKTCADTPSLATTIALTPKKPAVTHSELTQVNAGTACVNRNGKPSNYVVYALPSVPENHTITIGGQKEVLRAFAPSVSILDGAGKVIRDFPRDRLTNFGTTFAVQFRPSAEARYILVQSDADLVGTVMSAFETNVVTNTGYAYNAYTGGGGSYTTQRGIESGTTRGFSHEGLISVYVQAVRGKIGLPEGK